MKSVFAGTAVFFVAIALPLTAIAQVSPGRGSGPAMNLNPDISVIIDTIFYGQDGDASLSERLEGLRGFKHVYEEDDAYEKGFNMRHLELMFQADIDPYFRGWAIVGVEEDGAELEEAVAVATGLPWGLQLKLGKFFSDFSRLNAQHAHEWNFTDMSLAHLTMLGDHGLNEKGVQLSWLTPAPFYLNTGIEVLQGDNETAFEYHGDGPLPERSGPRLFLGWLRAAPNTTGFHAMEAGVFAARGVRQEEALGDEGHEDPDGRYFDGHQIMWGADVVYKYTPPRAYGHGTFTLEGGYLARRKDLDLVASNNLDEAVLLGRSLKGNQDGLYLQTLYGIAPRWRVGVRGEVLGLINNETGVGGVRESFDESYRATAMVDWTLTEFARLRLQGAHGRYDFEDGKESVSEVFVQAVFSIGAHGAHRF